MAKVLVIDDSVSVRRLVAATLTSEGHVVTESANGAQALGLANKTQFDLLLVDLNMPVMDGLTVIRLIRPMPAYQRTPMLILTTDSTPAKMKIAKDIGATGWLVKPFDPEQLLGTVRKVLG
jgi:two-component system chemotaxis response regulator CheY